MSFFKAFQPPPVYSQRTLRMNPLNNVNANANPNAQQPPNAAALRQFQQLQQHRMLQQQEKERLLQLQQQQKLVVPVNATAGADQICK